MRRLVLLCALAALCLTSASVALAARTPVVKEIRGLPRYTYDAGKGLATIDCRLGNQNAPVYYVEPWFEGMESYKFLFHPQQTDHCSCPFGFQIVYVHMFLYFPAGAINTPMKISADLEDAAWDGARGCWVPGVEDCVSLDYAVSVPAEGIYDVSLPITCGCAYLNYWYLISFKFGLAPAARPAIVVDAGPILPCTNWNDWGSGWQDLSTLGWNWNLAMYADAACCNEPVEVEQNTWGGVKSLYK